MNITGIIAEYNPFHLGHAYHIATAKEKADAQYTIAIINGSFVQRGSCAITDKYTRTRAALSQGADLVLELPVLYGLSSAEYFAFGAVKTLHKLGIVSHLAFGSESDNLASLKEVARILADEPDNYRLSLKKALAKGNSFPKAREYALRENYPNLCNAIFLEQPNTILGIEYCKSLYQCQSTIEPVVIQRQGSGYHELQADTLFSSASSIRRQLSEADTTASPLSDAIQKQLPNESFQALQAAYNYSFPVFDEDLSAWMRFSLLCVPNQDYTPYLDVTEELSNRIRNQLFAYESFHQFASLLKTKELTYSRICRCLLHILLGITDQYMEYARDCDYVPYFHILGMKASASPLLKEIRKHSGLPIITNPADFLKGSPSNGKLSPSARKMLELDCLATHIWNGIAGEKFHHQTECEYTRRFMKL